LYPSLLKKNKFRKGLKMKVLLIKDIYKLGRAGDIKKVANGFGRNYLIPQGLAILATPGALKQVDQIRSKATASRDALNQELGGLAQQLSDLVLEFTTKAGETGKLYGSITTQNIATSIQEKIGVEVDRRDIETQPIRTLGEHKVAIRLTIDLMPEITILVRREGEAVIEAKAEEDIEEESAELSESGAISDAAAEVDLVETPEVESPAEVEVSADPEPVAEDETPVETAADAPEIEEAGEAESEPEKSDE
jgi:large subunit ribosomal protein L9